MTYEDYRPIPFWSWNDKLEENDLIEQVRWMHDAGFGGFFMHARSGLETQYLGGEWFDCIKACCLEAKRLGMSAWAYDENGWPSGFAGGKLLEKEETRDRFLTYTIGDYDPKAMVSYDIGAESFTRVRENTKIPEECLNVYEHTAVSTADILNKDVVDTFISLTHQRYKSELGESFYGSIAGFFTDEPQYQRWSHPYTRVLPAYFQEKYGEDPLEGLGLLFVEREGYRAFRYKYWLCMQELMLSAFGKNIYDWCDKNGVQLTGHYFQEDTLAGQMKGCAGVMPFYEYEHIPGIDRLGKNNWTIAAAKQASSVARQLGKRRVITESFAGCGWNATPAELKRIAEHQYVCGVNLLCHHLLPYSETGQRKRDYPMHFSPVTPWVKKDIKTFNDYFTKLGYLLGESEEVVSVALFCPIRSMYFHYKHGNPTAGAEIEDSYSQAISMLSRMNIPYHIIDETILEKHGSCDGNALKVGNCSYDTVIFPKTETMSWKNHQMMEMFYHNGGKLLFLEGIPAYVEGEPYEYRITSNVSLAQIMNAQAYQIDKIDTKVFSTLHKDAQGRHFLYAVNTSGSKEYEVTFMGGFQSFRSYDIEKDTYCDVAPTLTFRPGQSRILYFSNKKVASEESRKEINLKWPMEIIAASDNYMVLDRIYVSYDGVEYAEECSCTKLLNCLLENRYEGDLWLKYYFDIQELPSRLHFLTEDMNICSCHINGHEMTFAGCADFEKRILRADISKQCKCGRNEVVMKIRFFERDSVFYALYGEGVSESLRNCLVYDTTIEACYLQGDFGVYSHEPFTEDPEKGTYLCEGGFHLGKQKKMVTDFAKDGYPFFAGNLTLKTVFESDGEPCDLRLPKNVPLVYLKINGRDVDKGYFDELADISAYIEKGKNVAELTVYTGNRNLLGPHHYIPEAEPKFATPQKFDFILRYKNGECDRERKSYSFVKIL